MHLYCAPATKITMLKIKAYHGSNNKFEQFSFDNIGTTGTSGGGYGVYFSSNNNDAAMYGNYLYEVELSLKNSISNNYISFSKEEVSLILELLKKEGYDYIAEGGTIENLFEYSKSDTEIIGDVANAFGGYNGSCAKELMHILSDMEYTHAINDEYTMMYNVTHYIIFDLEAIEITYNYGALK